MIPERDITYFHSLFSEDTGNGVYGLNRVHHQTRDCSNPSVPTSRGPLGPIGFNMKDYPYSGAPWDQDSRLYYMAVHQNDIAAITYQESSPEIEERWLREVPCAARTLPACLLLVLDACFDSSNKEIQKAALSMVSDMEEWLDRDVWVSLLEAVTKDEKTVDNLNHKEAILAFLTKSKAIRPQL